MQSRLKYARFINIGPHLTSLWPSRRLSPSFRASGLFIPFLLLLLNVSIPVIAHAQDTVTGAFQGTINDSQTGGPIKGALVEIINQQTGVVISQYTNYRGQFFQGLLIPGNYRIRVSYPGYETREVPQSLKITYTGEVIPVPVTLDRVGAAPAPVGSPTPVPTAADN